MHVYIDLAFCLVLLPLMVIMLPVERWYHHSPMFVFALVSSLYGVYFLNRFLTVPLLFKGGKRRMLAAGGLIALSVGVAYLLATTDIDSFAGRKGPERMEHHDGPPEPKPEFGPGHHKHHRHGPGPLHKPGFPPHHRHKGGMGSDNIFPFVPPHTQGVWLLFALVETFSFVVSLLLQTNEQRARRRAVEAERDHAQIQLYKNQIKPHFMFNTLNSLYGLFLTGNPQALNALEQFISMMRYMHISADRDMVSIAEEADYLRQYVEMQSLRLGETTTLDLEIEIADHDLTVPPMLLVTFVENCFKHGVSSVESSTIQISLVEKDGILTLKTRNKIFPVKQDSEHVGILNSRRRLDLLYPGAYTLDIVSDDEFFNITLKIILK